MKRVQQLAQHLTAAAAPPANDVERDENAALREANEPKQLVWQAGARIEDVIGRLPSQLPAPGEYDPADHLPGPLRDAARFPGGWLDAFKAQSKWSAKGEQHVLLGRWAQEYGDRGMASNIVVPTLMFGREGMQDEGGRMPPVVTQEVIIGDPEDARRLARVHVKKQPNFSLFFFGSIISTRDNDKWRAQREQIVPAFLPQASLAQVFPTSAARAQHCAERLSQLSRGGAQPVDMNDFLLHETQAQLQLAMFGESQEFMERTNEPFRRSMAGASDPRYVRGFCTELGDRWDRDELHGAAAAADVSAGALPAPNGPLAVALAGVPAAASGPRTRDGNALIFAFAGHDTTGHTMSWLLLELARHPDVQRRLQAEIDGFFAELGDRALVYDDLQKLPFLSRCITETLRLWPAVANGTFRELERDDDVAGPNGARVRLPAGTLVRIVNWSRHRNPDLWGPDVDEFNPDRDFVDEEIWHGRVLAAYNPATPRFSPFQFTPRGCVGMNFAQMEARLIMANLLRAFSFELTPEFAANFDPKTYLGVNYGTMGPQDVTQPDMIRGRAGWAPPLKRPLGLPMKIVPRRNA